MTDQSRPGSPQHPPAHRGFDQPSGAQTGASEHQSGKKALPEWVEYERHEHARWMAQVPSAEVKQVAELTVGGRPARLYRPGPGRLPVLVYLHGGGWVMGDVDCYDGVARALAVACGAVVVSVDYRRPPEEPFPAALEDTVAAVAWVAEHAADWDVDAARIGVAGDSAGGQLAAAAALRLAAEGGPAPALQLLIYPALDLRDQPGHPDLLTRVMEAYVGGRDRTQELVSPLLASDVAVLPPTVIAAAEHDVLNEQGERFAERLRAAGVPVVRLPGTGLQHGFLGQLGVLPAADDYLTRIGHQVGLLWGAAGHRQKD